MHCSFSPSLEYLPPLHSCNMEYEAGGKDIWWVAEVLWFAYFRAEELRQGPIVTCLCCEGPELHWGTTFSLNIWTPQQASMKNKKEEARKAECMLQVSFISPYGLSAPHYLPFLWHCWSPHLRALLLRFVVTHLLSNTIFSVQMYLSSWSTV